MKIVFFISIHRHGRGGHAHSLNHISREIGKHNEVKIISIGPGKSNIIEANPYFHKHLYFNGLNVFNIKRELEVLKTEFKPNIYHCFDVGSYNVIRLFVSSKKNKIVLNKCGGPNPTKYRFPFVYNLVLFSLENKSWFENNSKFRNTFISLIPNRVQEISHDPDFHPIEKQPKDFNFVRICRIGNTYKKSINDSINLIESLLQKGFKNVKLYIIGVVEDKFIYDELKQNNLVKYGEVVILTDTNYTTEASKMLYLADAIIGTGRGLMESSSLSKPVLAIDKNGDLPVLLDEINFEDAFKTNFSERNVFSNTKFEKNLNNVIKLITDEVYYSEISTFSKSCFDKFFDLEKVTQYYIKAYNNSVFGNRKLLSDLPLILLNLISYYRSSKKNKRAIKL